MVTKERYPRCLKAGTLQNSCSAPFVLVTILVSNFTVVVLVGGAAEHPASSPELQDLQQQQTGHGGQALLEQEAVPQQEEQLVHPLAVHLLQLLSDAVQLQHQAVHLQREVEEVSVTLLSLVSLVYFILKAIFLACTFKKKNCMFVLTSSSFIRASGWASLIRQSNTGWTRATIGMLFTYMKTHMESARLKLL